MSKVNHFATEFRKKNGQNSKVFVNISTHGVRCKNAKGEIKWGFVIPITKLDLRNAAPKKNDPEYLFNCDSVEFSKLFISAEDLSNTINPSGIILDTCYSGHFEKNLLMLILIF